MSRFSAAKSSQSSLKISPHTSPLDFLPRLTRIGVFHGSRCVSRLRALLRASTLKMDDDSIFAMLDGMENQAHPQGSSYFTQMSHTGYGRSRPAPERQQVHSRELVPSHYGRGGNTGTHQSYDLDQFDADIPFDDFGE